MVPLSCPKMLFSVFPQFKVRRQCLRLVFPPKHWQEVTSDITDYPKLLKVICLKTKNTATSSKLHLREDKAQLQQTKPAKQNPTTWPSTLIPMGLRASSNQHPHLNDSKTQSEVLAATLQNPVPADGTHSCREPWETGMTCPRKSLRPRPSTQLIVSRASRLQ